MAKMQWNAKALNNILDVSQQAILKIGFELERDIKKSFAPGSGIIYMKGKNKNIAHQASAPGETPAVDTGRLRASISTNWTNSGLSNGKIGNKASTEDGVGNPGGSINNNAFVAQQFKVVVGTNVEYAPFLEFGTSRMAARPFMRPAFEAIKPKIEKFIVKGK